MKLFYDFIQNLITQKIPMPKRWLRSMNLSVEKTKVTEKDNVAISENYGYSFLDSLKRGSIVYKPKTFEYTPEAHYLLGMYLRALKDLKEINYMPFYNCVIKAEQIYTKKYSYVPIILGETYSIYADTILPIFVRVRIGFNDETIYEKNVGYTSGGAAKIFDTNEIPYYPELENVLEYLELVVITNYNVQVTVLEGTYQNMPTLPVTKATGSKLTSKVEILGNGLIGSTLYPRLMKPFRIEGLGESEELEIQSEKEYVPVQLASMPHFSPKLIECLLGTSINEKSSKSLRQILVSSVGNNLDVTEAIKVGLDGLYDVDGNSDKRLKLEVR